MWWAKEPQIVTKRGEEMPRKMYTVITAKIMYWHISNFFILFLVLLHLTVEEVIIVMYCLSELNEDNYHYCIRLYVRDTFNLKIILC